MPSICKAESPGGGWISHSHWSAIYPSCVLRFPSDLVAPTLSHTHCSITQLRHTHQRQRNAKALIIIKHSNPVVSGGVSFPCKPRAMAMASTSAAVLQGISTPFLSGSRAARNLLNVTAGGRASSAAAGSPRRLLVVAAAAPKKSWIPAVKGGGNFIDPEWLDGS